jgi:hypothetical protein
VPIADLARIGVAVLSYQGRLFVGVTADRASGSDVGVMPVAIEPKLTDLVRVARSELNTDNWKLTS